MKKLYLMSLFFVISSLHVQAQEYVKWRKDFRNVGPDITCRFYYSVTLYSPYIDLSAKFLRFDGSGKFYSNYFKKDSGPWRTAWFDVLEPDIARFYLSTLSGFDVEFNGTVEEVPDYAFADWSQVENIKLNTNLQYIGENAFIRCSRLPDLTFYGNHIGIQAFAYCSSLKSIVLEPLHGRLTIGYGAFRDCLNLTDVTIKSEVVPDAIFSIFWNTPNLTTVKVPKSALVRYAAERFIWADVPFLEPIEGGFDFKPFKPNIIYGKNGDCFTWAVIDTTLYLIGEGRMPDYPNMESVPWYPYRDRIKAINIGSLIGPENVNITYIGDYSFAGLTGLGTDISTVKFPSTPVSLGNYIFANTGIESIQLPNIDIYPKMSIRI